jgi:hypothetical protein
MDAIRSCNLDNPEIKTYQNRKKGVVFLVPKLDYNTSANPASRRQFRDRISIK